METECGDLKPNITANAKFWPHIINHRQLGGSVMDLQGDPSGYKSPVDLVPTVLVVGGPLLQLPTTRAGWRNIPNPSQHPNGSP